MKVKEWTSYDRAQEFECGIGGWGGWFENGMRWKDYIEEFDDDKQPYHEAIKDSVIANSSRLTGMEHQNDDHGVPKFDDDTVGLFSFRSWGDLMAPIWSEEEDKDYGYLNFTCDFISFVLT